MRLEDFRNRHAGEDVWVVGSDASVGFFPAGFFDGRTVIGVNRAAWVVPVTYTMTKADFEHQDGWLSKQMAEFPGVITFSSKHQEGIRRLPKVNVPGVVLFDHLDNPGADFDARSHIPQTGLLVSQTTSGSALHLAAYMGARTVFCVGLSGGSFGHRLNVDGYREQGESDLNTMRIGSRQMQPIADELHRLYGTEFVTVLPWANMRLGDVGFHSDYATINHPV